MVARARRDDPAGWRFGEDERAGIWRAIAERRDIRRFRPDPLPEELVTRLLEAAHQAPSVGLMQPWRFIVIRDEQTKTATCRAYLPFDAFQGGSRDAGCCDLKHGNHKESTL